MQLQIRNNDIIGDDSHVLMDLIIERGPLHAQRPVFGLHKTILSSLC